MTRDEYRKKTRVFDPANDETEAKYIKEYTKIKHSKEYYTALDEYGKVYTNLEENFNCYKDMKSLDKKENMLEDINKKHARIIILKCAAAQLKRQKFLTSEMEIINKKIKQDEEKDKIQVSKDNTKIEAVEEVRSILNDTLSLVLEMQETKEN